LKELKNQYVEDKLQPPKDKKKKKKKKINRKRNKVLAI
jgi:hypothetical protein